MEKLSGHKSPSANGRFGVMAAVTPQTILREFARYYPAASAVKPPLCQAAFTLCATSLHRIISHWQNINYLFSFASN